MTAARTALDLSLDGLGRDGLIALVRALCPSIVITPQDIARAHFDVLHERANKQHERWRIASAKAKRAAMEAKRIAQEQHWKGPAYEAATQAAHAAHALSQTEWRILRRHQIAADKARAVLTREQRKHAA